MEISEFDLLPKFPNLSTTVNKVNNRHCEAERFLSTPPVGPITAFLPSKFEIILKEFFLSVLIRNYKNIVSENIARLKTILLLVLVSIFSVVKLFLRIVSYSPVLSKRFCVLCIA